MNCFEFRKIALSDPYSENAEFVEHGSSCDKCATHIADILLMDDRLRDALSIKASDDLKARLKLRQVLEKEKVKHKRFRRFAYAASTLMAIGLVALTYQNHSLNQRYLTYHQAVVDHIAYEDGSLTSVQATAQLRMKAHLASLADIPANNLPGLRYSQLCPVLGKDTWHAVLETPSGEVVTVIYFDGEKLPNKTLHKDGWNSKVVAGERGDILLLGKSKRALDSAETNVTNHITI